MSAPDDVLIDILLRLPADCVIRFRCVSKHWSFLTRNPNFIASHLSRSNSNDEDDDDDFSLICLLQNNNVLCDDLNYIIYGEELICLSGADFRVRHDIEIPSRARDYRWLRLRGSCNGILCLAYGFFDAGIALWNPAIGQVKLVPPSVRSWPLELDSRPFVYIRFGYDSKTDDYKVLRLVNYRDNACCYTHLYSLATDSWKELDQHRKISSGTFDEAYVDGVFYWYGEDVILSFDLVDEKFHEIPRPKRRGQSSLVNWKGSLGFCRYQRGTEEFHIWVLNTDGKSWTRLLKIATTDLDLDLEFNSNYLIGQRKHGEIIFLSLNDNFGYWVILVFDPQTRETKKLHPPFNRELISSCYSYKASLVTLKGAVELDEHGFCNTVIDPYLSFASNPPDFAERKH